MRRGEPRASRERGFTYLGLLVLVTLIGLMLAAAGEVERTALQREREQELLWVGHEYRAAIGRYVAHTHRYPATLADLLGATRADPGGADPGDSAGPTAAPGVIGTLGFRALRRLYRDPMTNSVEWVTIPSPDGRIMGVVSASTQAPLKRTGFDDDDVAFAGADSYAGWQFVYQPALTRWRPLTNGAN